MSWLQKLSNWLFGTPKQPTPEPVKVEEKTIPPIQEAPKVELVKELPIAPPYIPEAKVELVQPPVEATLTVEPSATVEVKPKRQSKPASKSPAKKHTPKKKI